MIVGQGTTFVFPNTATPPTVFPPFPANAAENGLSVDPVSGAIVWGQDIGAVGDPAELLNAREVPMNGFPFTMRDGINPLFSIDPLTPQVFLGDFNFSLGASYFWTNYSAPPAIFMSTGIAGFASVGDSDGLGNGTELELDDTAMLFDIRSQNIFRLTDPLTGDRYQFFDIPNKMFQLGDIDQAGNNNIVDISDNSEEIRLGSFNFAPGFSFLYLSTAVGIEQMSWIGQTTQFDLDSPARRYRMGDISVVGAGNFLSIDDANQRWEIGQVAAVQNLLINFPTAGIGLSFFDSNGNNPFLLPDPGLGGIAFMSAPDFATQIALSDAGNGRLAQLGNVGASNNGNVFTVDDVNGLFIVTNTALNAAMQINGVNGFTGVVAPVNTITVDGGIVTNVA